MEVEYDKLAQQLLAHNKIREESKSFIYYKIKKMVQKF